MKIGDLQFEFTEVGMTEFLTRLDYEFDTVERVVQQILSTNINGQVKVAFKGGDRNNASAYEDVFRREFLNRFKTFLLKTI